MLGYSVRSCHGQHFPCRVLRSPWVQVAYSPHPNRGRNRNREKDTYTFGWTYTSQSLASTRSWSIRNIDIIKPSRALIGGMIPSR